MQNRLTLKVRDRHYVLSVRREDERVHLTGELDSEPLQEVTAQVAFDPPWMIVRVEDQVHRCLVAPNAHGVWVSLRGRSYFLETTRGAAGPAAAGAASDEVRAPMTGTLLSVDVEAGATVARGDLLAVMEAMKMEYRLEAPLDGTVERVECRPGDMLDVGTLIIKLQAAESA